MKTNDFIEKRNLLLQEKEAFIEQINLKYTAIHDEFIDECSPVKKASVYELLENGNKRRGFKRFVIYEQAVRWFDKKPMIQVGGWWLNSENIPTKWDNMTVSGIGNPAIFNLSDNQNYEKHPDSTD